MKIISRIYVLLIVAFICMTLVQYRYPELLNFEWTEAGLPAFIPMSEPAETPALTVITSPETEREEPKPPEPDNLPVTTVPPVSAPPESLTASETEASAAELPPESVTVALAGDIIIDRAVKTFYKERGFDGIFSDNAESGKNADIFMINLELPFSSRGTPMPGKEWTFRGDPEHIKILNSLGVDIVSIANNHTLDYGDGAFLDTLGLLDESEVRYVGGGENSEEASGYEIFEINGMKIAFLAASRVLPNGDWYAEEAAPGLFSAYDPAQLIEKIGEAAKEADYVVAYLHWGVEYSTVPEQWQRETAKQYIDAGASCVVGAHPHILQGIEYYKGKPIIYSLGNFIYMNGEKDTVIAEVSFGEDISVKLIPYIIESSKTFAADDPEDRERILKHMRDVSFNASIDNDFAVTEAE